MGDIFKTYVKWLITRRYYKNTPTNRQGKYKRQKFQKLARGSNRNFTTEDIQMASKLGKGKNANWNYKETLPHTHQNGLKTTTTTKIDYTMFWQAREQLDA